MYILYSPGRDCVSKKTMFGKRIHANLFLLGLVGLAFSLPVSVFTTSVFLILLVVNWVFEGGFSSKLQILGKRRSMWFILLVYLVFLAGLLFTRDFRYAFHDLRIKLPMLLIPLVIGTSEPFGRKQLTWVLYALVAGVMVGSIASSMVLFGMIDHPYNDIREISIFVHHIRFSLLIDIAIFSLVYFLLSREFDHPPWQRVLYAMILVWLMVFLVLFQSVTGIMILVAAGFILFWIFFGNLKSLMLRWTLVVFIISGIFIGLSLLTYTAGQFSGIDEPDPDSLEMYTENGNPYVHDFSRPYLENGSYIWLYICEEELEKEWNRISSLEYRGKDMMGQDLRHTLIRYLTSLGLRKDSAGVSRLEPADIELIERGKANYIYGEKYTFNSKLYEIFWQVDVYRKGGNPSGHSVTQRINYLRAALAIFEDHFWTGVGTGDVQAAYDDYYERIHSTLSERWRLRAHNQFMTFLLTYGIFGFMLIIAGFIWPVFMEKKWGDYFMVMFLIISFCSMITEDTLETHTGVSYFAFFYALFLFGSGKNRDNGHGIKPD